MNSSKEPLPPPAERVWLHRSQWRTVGLLILLLGAVVASLALAAGYWWALRAREATTPAPLAATPAVPVPVATVTLPAETLSVAEVFPATVVLQRGARVVVRSPGGTVAAVPVRQGQPLRAGQPLVRLVQRVPTPAVPRARTAAAPRPSRPAAPQGVTASRPTNAPALARRQREVNALRRRLAGVQSEIARSRRVAAAAAAPAVTPAAWQARAAMREAEAHFLEAQEALQAASRRRREFDRRYEEGTATRFQYHLNRSAETLAEVEVRHAGHAVEEARQVLTELPPAADRSAATRAFNRAARLEAEARRIEARLAQVQQRVAGMRQYFAPSRPSRPLPAGRPVTEVRRPVAEIRRVTKTRPVIVSAPRTGTVGVVWAQVGEAAAPGAALIEVETPGRTLVQARVSGNALRSFKTGARVDIRRRDGSTVNGRVARVHRQSTGTGIVEVVPPPGILLGETITLLPAGSRFPRRTIPASALSRGTAGTTVWVAAPALDNGKAGHWIAQQRTVRTVPVGGSRVAIAAGLHIGDSVIVAGGRDLRDGQPVAPVEIGFLRD